MCSPIRLTRPGAAQTPAGRVTVSLGEGVGDNVGVRHGSYSTSVLAACAVAADPDDPLTALRVGEIEPPPVPDGWVRVEVRAAALNQHDVWSLRGVGLPAERLPMILGCDAAGVSAGRPRGDRARGGQRSGLRRLGRDLRPAPLAAVRALPGHAGRPVWVPAANLVDKPAELSFAEAACLPTAWLTAYRMLFTASGARPGDTVLVQGAGGGVATALVVLGRQAGLRMWVTSRDERGARGRWSSAPTGPSPPVSGCPSGSTR